MAIPLNHKINHLNMISLCACIVFVSIISLTTSVKKYPGPSRAHRDSDIASLVAK